MKAFAAVWGIFALMILTPVSTSFSQDLYNGPESVAFDSLYNRYLVSNFHDGSIVQVDSDGIQSYFITGLGRCLGNVIIGNTLYVSTIDSLAMGIDLATAQIVAIFGLSIVGSLDGQAADTSGFLYIVDTGGRIFKVDPATGNYSIFASEGLSPGLQDIVFDSQNNRLLAVSYYQNAPIQAINLSDSTVYDVVPTSFGYFDGITRDQFGNTYVATYSNSGSIYRYDPEFASEPELISSGHQGPAGMDYNRLDNILAVPNFYANRVDFIPIEVTSAEGPEIPLSIKTMRNYPNPFNAYTVIEFSLSQSSNFRLEIFDDLGRRLETFSGSNYPAGDHRVIWNADGYSSGTYFYRIQAGEYSQSRKMILLK